MTTLGMDTITLAEPTGDARADALLRGIIELVELTLPGRIRAVYLFGSFADGSAGPASDLDLFLVTATPITADEAARRDRLAHACALVAGRAVELVAIDEATVLREGHFRIAAAGRLLYGADLRGRLPPVSLDAYLGLYTQAPWDYITQVPRAIAYRAAGYLAYPLAYPDPAGEFYGYDRPRLPHREEPCRNTHALIATACWIATVIVGLRAGRTVPAKSASVRLYRELIGDAWAPWLEELDARGRRAWGYLVPAAPEERAALRALCRPMLAFENHYLDLYRAYLLERIGADGPARLAAVERLATLVFPDDAMAALLASLAQDADEAVRQAAAVAARHLALAREAG